jgi:aspartate/methionine/tyrosine aminotransferase
MDAVQSPIIAVVRRLIQQHAGTISLGQGMVYYGPPAAAMDQISAFWQDPDQSRYGSTAGMLQLRQAMADKLSWENGILTSSLDTIIVTAGSNMGFVHAVLAITQPGDEIILQLPYYFNHEMAIRIAGCCPVLVATDQSYQLQPHAIAAAITERTRAVVTISPNNPSGAVYPQSALQQVNDLCRQRGLYHIHDEAYEYFLYNNCQHFSPGSLPKSQDHTISLFSLSKAYGFASWRIGYMVIPPQLLPAILKIQDTVLIAPPLITQYAALGALQAGQPYCQAKLQILQEVREIALQELDPIRPVCTLPVSDGAFYFLLKLQTDLADMVVVERLIREHHVAVIPGSTFGLTQGCYLRVAYGALERETAVTGIQRLVEGLKAILQL